MNSSQVPCNSSPFTHDLGGPAAYGRLFELWKKEGLRRPTTLEDYRRALDGFGNFINWMAIPQIRRQDVLSFRDHLLARGLSPITVKQRIGMLKSFARVALDYEWLQTDPTAQVRISPRLQPKARIAFSADDLNQLFRSRIYSENFCPRGGGYAAAYWLPLLALFTGARVEELAQLRNSHVRHLRGLGFYLEISDTEYGQLKNSASRRRIPIHDSLLRCGFLTYLASVQDSEFIFPGLKPNPRGKRGGYFSNFFSGYLRQQVGITDRRKVFHSFRHTFKDICRSVGIDEEVHDALTGHTRAGASRHYGNENYPLPPLFEAMRRFTVDGLKIGHLHVADTPAPKRSEPCRTISRYYGIDVSLALNNTAPVIIARYENGEVAICVNDNSIKQGQLPSAKLILVQAWVEIHRDALVANWENAQRTGEAFTIAPLH